MAFKQSDIIQPLENPVPKFLSQEADKRDAELLYPWKDHDGSHLVFLIDLIFFIFTEILVLRLKRHF